LYSKEQVGLQKEEHTHVQDIAPNGKGFHQELAVSAQPWKFCHYSERELIMGVSAAHAPPVSLDITSKLYMVERSLKIVYWVCV
jgi:hypothetical protein